jgi:hypothetical protein
MSIPTPIHESRNARIAREDRDFEIYGKRLLQRWLKHKLPSAVSSHRTRATRNRAARIGKWLCEARTLEWLARYRIDVATLLDVQYTKHMADGNLVIGVTTVFCGVEPGGRKRPYMWEVRMEGPVPGCSVDGKLQRQYHEPSL